MSREAQWVTGRVVAVQETRFGLDDGGRVHLLILSHDAPVEAGALQLWQRRGVRVAVRLRKLPGTIACAALDAHETPAAPVAAAQAPPELVENSYG